MSCVCVRAFNCAISIQNRLKQGAARFPIELTADELQAQARSRLEPGRTLALEAPPASGTGGVFHT